MSRQSRIKIGDGTSGIVWYEAPSRQGVPAVITKQSKTPEQDQSLRDQRAIYTYLNDIQGFQRHLSRILPRRTTGERQTLSMQSQDRSRVTDLFDLLTKTAITPEIATKIGMDLLDAITFLHDHNVVHGDIKLENIIVNKDNHVKLIDFGFSYMMGHHTKFKKRGTRSYFPPGFLIKKPLDYYDILGYDLWATGIVLLVLIFISTSDKDEQSTIGDVLGPLLDPNSNDPITLTPHMKRYVDAVLERWFPKYELKLFETHPLDRYLVMRATPPTQAQGRAQQGQGKAQGKAQRGRVQPQGQGLQQKRKRSSNTGHIGHIPIG